MAEGVSGRLRHAGLKAGTVTVKIRDSGFNTISRQRGRGIGHSHGRVASATIANRTVA